MTETTVTKVEKMVTKVEATTAEATTHKTLAQKTTAVKTRTVMGNNQETCLHLLHNNEGTTGNNQEICLHLLHNNKEICHYLLHEEETKVLNNKMEAEGDEEVKITYPTLVTVELHFYGHCFGRSPVSLAKLDTSLISIIFTIPLYIQKYHDIVNDLTEKVQL